MKKSFLLFIFYVFCAIIFVSLSLSGCATEYNPATGKEEDIIMSREKEIKKGRAISKSVEKKFKSVDDWQLQNRISNIGQKLAVVSDRKDLSYHFEVLSDKHINAFALPGGYVYVFKGLIDKLESDDEIAAVLAHEIGHITAKHHPKRSRGSIGYTALLLLIGRMDSDPVSRRKAYAAINELMMSYSREDELEADRLSVKYAKGAGFNTKAILTVLEKLRQINYEKPIKPKTHWRTHPYIDDRIKAVKELIFSSIEFEDYINVAPEYLNGQKSY